MQRRNQKLGKSKKPEASETFAGLSDREVGIIKNALEEVKTNSCSVLSDMHEDRSFGEQMADLIAFVCGSWTFIVSFTLALTIWIALNTWVLANKIDPFPYTLLNLMLACITALQAPIIMKSQNRQAEQDRKRAERDLKLSIKTEYRTHELIEKMKELNEKIDKLRGD